jgi:uncharacterized protein (UPF0335 family)
MSHEGHNSKAGQEELEAIAQRIERLQDEKRIAAKEYGDAIKEVFAEAKGRGYDTAAIKEVLRLRAMSEDKREMLRFYSDVLGVFG